MKSVLLIGDSIRIGYDKALKKTLEGKAEVYFPEENCRFAAYVLRYLGDYQNLVPNKAPDVLHWNTGLWDCLHMYEEETQTPLEVYRYYIDRLCIRIRKLFPSTHVIFATSTSVQSELMDKNFKRYNPEIEAFNAAAVEVVKKHGFEVNDLYAVSAALPAEAHSDAVHYYTPMGTKAFTDAVLSRVAPALGIEEAIEYREELHTDAPIGI